MFYVLDARNEEGAQTAIEELKSVLGDQADIRREPMYAVIACHTGLGAVGMQYVKKVKGE